MRGGLRPRRAQPGDAVSPRAECRLVRLQPPGAGPHEAGDAPIHRPFMLVDPRGGPPALARRQLTLPTTEFACGDLRSPRLRNVPE